MARVFRLFDVAKLCLKQKLAMSTGPSGAHVLYPHSGFVEFLSTPVLKYAAFCAPTEH